jgi:hypothetical protein
MCIPSINLIPIINLPAAVKPVKKSTFRVIAFFSAKSELAHISFIHEANRWFSEMALKHNFIYDSTTDWNSLNSEYLSKYQVVIFLGTGPKQYEIWHSGYNPVVWTNINYKMLYINMGHNDIDYDNKTNKELSFTFRNKTQNKLILDGLFWLGKNK